MWIPFAAAAAAPIPLDELWLLWNWGSRHCNWDQGDFLLLFCVFKCRTR